MFGGGEATVELQRIWELDQTMTFDSWNSADYATPQQVASKLFPPWSRQISLGEAPKACVYVLFLVMNGKEIPFYVGESGRFQSRICDDYRLEKRNGLPLKKFKAPTDFCVAEAVGYLRSKGQHVRIRFKESSSVREERRREEREIIRSLVTDGWRLLNCLGRFNPNQASQEEERKMARKFSEMLCKLS